MRRWVRYETAIMVCVDLDNADSDDTVINVVLADDHDDIALARDHDGHILVYDQAMNRLDESDLTNSAIMIAEYREWPQRDDWEQGPDALRYPGLYDIDEDDGSDNDDRSPLKLEGRDPPQ